MFYFWLFQEAADVMMEALKAIPGQVGQYCLFTVETCAYAARLVKFQSSESHGVGNY